MKRGLTASAIAFSFAFGLVAASSADTVSTAWAEPVDGTWLESAKWTNDVPVADSIAEIVTEGTYTVTMQYLVTDVPSVIRLGGGATLDVPCTISTWMYPMELLDGGRLLITGRSRLTPEVFLRFAFAGGVVEYDAANTVANVWGDGDTTLTNVNLRLAGKSRTGIGDSDVTGLRLGIVSTNGAQVSKLALAGESQLSLAQGELTLGSFGLPGVAELEVESGRGVYEAATFGSPKALYVGYEGGTGRVVQAGALLEFSDTVSLGAVQSAWFDQTLESRAFDPVGLYEQSAGSLQVDGASVLTADRPTGVLIGDGSRPGSSESALFTGVYALSGGVIDCRRAYLMVGLGKGDGKLVQTGGTVRQNVKAADGVFAPMVLGWKGGSGTWEFGGTAQTDFGDGASLYIGGMDDSRLVKSLSWVSLYSIKSKGKLVIGDGATFVAPSTTVLGESGEGVIEIAATGKFTGASLKATAGSSSSVSFTASATGFGTLRLSGAFEADSATKIVVDFAGFAPVGKATIIEAGSLSGLAVSNVEIENAPSGREVEVSVDDTSVVVGLKSGSLVIVR